MENNYNEANNQLMATNERLSSVMQELAKIDANALTVTEILKVLKKVNLMCSALLFILFIGPDCVRRT